MRYATLILLTTPLTGCAGFVEWIQQNPETAHTIGEGITDTAGMVFGLPGRLLVGGAVSLLLGYSALKPKEK